jgi:hypothetical protein
MGKEGLFLGKGFLETLNNNYHIIFFFIQLKDLYYNYQ